MTGMRIRLTTLQCATTIMMFISPTAFLVVPGFVMTVANQDAWMSIMAATAFGAGVAAWLGLFAASNRSGESFVDWLGGRAGKAIAFAAGLLFAYHLFVSASAALNEFVNFLSVNVLPRTPTAFLIAATTLVAMYSVSQGIENIARTCLLVTVLNAPFYLISVILLYPKMNFAHLLPIGEASAVRIAAGAFVPAGMMTEAAFILLLVPYMAKPKQAPKAAVWGVLIVGFEMLFTVVQSLSLFGPNLVRSIKYPSFELISIVQFGGFLERVDQFFIMVWILTVFLKITLLLFGAIAYLEQALRIRRGKLPFLWTIGLLIALDASVTWRQNFELQMNAVTRMIPLMGFNVLLPLGLWLTSLRPRRNAKMTEGDGA